MNEVLQTLTFIKDSIDALAQPRLIDWLGVFISLISAVISGVAIWFAVRVADKNNRISLLEKRIECYQEIQKHNIFLLKFEEYNDFEATLSCFAVAFSDGLTEEIEDVDLLKIKTNTKRIFSQMPVLYESIDFDEVDKVINSLLVFVDAINNWKEGEELDQKSFVDYFETIDKFIHKHEEIMRKNMRI